MSIIKSPYIMVFSRHYFLDYYEVETIQEGIDRLESGSDYELWFPVAVVEMSTKKMVYSYQFFLTNDEENQKLVDGLLKNLEYENE